jgi:hypothetical protein
MKSKLILLSVLLMLAMCTMPLILRVKLVQATSAPDLNPTKDPKLGDVNNDGSVGLDDVWAVAAAFGTFQGGPGWNSTLDLNGDGYVNLKDFFIVCQCFGS